jgi:hypothetical protein
MKDRELLPCPFCGSDGDSVAINHDNGTYEPGCSHCGTYIGQYSSTRSAAAAWNRRARLSEPQPDAGRRDTERAFQMLEMYGVSRERAKNVANGIQVLVTRMDREIAALRAEGAPAERELAALKADCVMPATDGRTMAKQFDDLYEKLAPLFGYETRADTKQFDPESPNGKLMIAVCCRLLAASQGRKGE